MIILTLWEWVINIFVLGITAVVWAIALFLISLLFSLVKDYLTRIIKNER